MALTTRTREELIRQALEEIEILGTGMPLEEDDQEKVDNFIDPLLARLASPAYGLFVGNPGDDTFDILHFIPLSQLLARDIASSFGVTGQELVDANMVATAALMELQKILSRGPTGEVMETDYF